MAYNNGGAPSAVWGWILACSMSMTVVKTLNQACLSCSLTLCHAKALLMLWMLMLEWLASIPWTHSCPGEMRMLDSEFHTARILSPVVTC